MNIGGGSSNSFPLQMKTPDKQGMERGGNLRKRSLISFLVMMMKKKKKKKLFVPPPPLCSFANTVEMITTT